MTEKAFAGWTQERISLFKEDLEYFHGSSGVPLSVWEHLGNFYMSLQYHTPDCLRAWKHAARAGFVQAFYYMAMAQLTGTFHPTDELRKIIKKTMTENGTLDALKNGTFNEFMAAAAEREKFTEWAANAKLASGHLKWLIEKVDKIKPEDALKIIENGTLLTEEIYQRFIDDAKKGKYPSEHFPIYYVSYVAFGDEEGKHAKEILDLYKGFVKEHLKKNPDGYSNRHNIINFQGIVDKYEDYFGSPNPWGDLETIGSLLYHKEGKYDEFVLEYLNNMSKYYIPVNFWPREAIPERRSNDISYCRDYFLDFFHRSVCGELAMKKYKDEIEKMIAVYLARPEVEYFHRNDKKLRRRDKIMKKIDDVLKTDIASNVRYKRRNEFPQWYQETIRKK